MTAVRCDVFRAQGDVRVTAGDVSRRYPGSVSASVAAVGVSLVRSEGAGRVVRPRNASWASHEIVLNPDPR